MYVPVAGGVSVPVQRTENPSAGRPVPGEPLPQLKLIVGSVRVSLGVPDSVMLSKYSPCRPWPLPDGGVNALVLITG